MAVVRGGEGEVSEDRPDREVRRRLHEPQQWRLVLLLLLLLLLLIILQMVVVGGTRAGRPTCDRLVVVAVVIVVVVVVFSLAIDRRRRRWRRRRSWCWYWWCCGFPGREQGVNEYHREQGHAKRRLIYRREETSGEGCAHGVADLYLFISDVILFLFFGNK